MQSTLQSKAGIHLAIIMDGNGRWATRRGLPRPAGHRAGANAVRRAIEAAPDLGIATLTLFAFSCDNWRRPPEEVNELMWLLRAYLRSEARRFIESGARLTVIGRRDRLPARLRTEIRRVERATAAGTKLLVRIALDYSARESIARAAARYPGDMPPTADDFGKLLAQTLSEEPSAAPLWMTLALHRILFIGTVMVVGWSHRRALARGGYSIRRFWAGCMHEFRRDLAAMRPYRLPGGVLRTLNDSR